MDSGAKTLIGFGIAAAAASAVAYAIVSVTGNKPKPLSDFEKALSDKANQAMTWADYDGHCTGYVGSIYRSLGVKVAGTVGYIANKAKQLGAFHMNKIPRVGDMIFFDNTWDANRNGLFDDPMTHIAIVLSVDPDGPITQTTSDAVTVQSMPRNTCRSPKFLVRPSTRITSSITSLQSLYRPGEAQRQCPVHE